MSLTSIMWSPPAGLSCTECDDPTATPLQTTTYTVQGEKIIVSYNIGEYEKQLKMFSFLRVHHQHLINLRHVKKYIKGRGGFALMSDGESIMVASRKKEEFINALTLSADA